MVTGPDEDTVESGGYGEVWECDGSGGRWRESLMAVCRLTKRSWAYLVLSTDDDAFSPGDVHQFYLSPAAYQKRPR